jgi:ribosomal protein S24E
LVGGIKHYDDNYSSIQWKNSVMAKKLINDAKHNINANPSKKELQNILAKIYDLLPEGAERYREPKDSSVLGY